jgi:predicted hydrocarbon binding protein
MQSETRDKNRTNKEKKGSSEPSKIPTTGRIGRLAKNIEKMASPDAAAVVMQNVEEFQSAPTNAANAAWLKKAMETLETLVGTETTVRIMEECGRKCCGQTWRTRAKQLFNKSKSMEEFIQNLNSAHLGGGRLKIQGDTITGGYDHCYCGQVKNTKDVFPLTYCHCSVGWYKQLFESALGRPVDVELVQSIVTGAETCEFIIYIGE